MIFWSELMKRQTLISSVVLATLFGLAPTEHSSAAPHYQENFTLENTNALPDFSWVDTDAESAVSGGNNDVGTYGDPLGVPQDGFVFWYSNLAIADASSVTELIYTNNFSPIDSSTSDLKFIWESRLESQFADDFSDMSGAGAPVGTRLALQLGGQWFVSNTSISSGNVTSADWTGNTLPFDPAAANWRELNNVDGSPGVSLGLLAGADLSGDITGAGLVSTFQQRQTLNINNFAIVPEPSALSLIFCGVVGVLGRKSRRSV
jgi:hypothetical protein